MLPLGFKKHPNDIRLIPEAGLIWIGATLDGFVRTQIDSEQYYEQSRNAVYAAKNIADGKIGELCVMYYLHEMYGMPLVDIDVESREGSGKGWRPDLMYPNLNIHVKTSTEEMNDRLGCRTWTFQYGNLSGVGGRDPMFRNECHSDYVALVELMADRQSYRMVYTAPVSYMIPRMRDPIKRDLIGLKKCIYEPHLDNETKLSFNIPTSF